jgi:outer membrane protein insertion porin family
VSANRAWLCAAKSIVRFVAFGGLLVLTDGALGVHAAGAQTASAIVVTGTRRVEAETVRSYFRVGANGQLDAAAIDAALKALYASGFFRDVKISRVGDRLTVTVVEAPVINKVQIEGNKALKDEQLKGELQSKPLGGLTQAKIQSDVTRLAELYHHMGRYDVRIEPKTIEQPGDRVDLVFEVHEGEKTTVKKIAFIGNNSFSERRLKDVIKTAETGLLSFIQNNNVYDPDLIEADRDLLRRFYLKSGFADVQIVSATALYDQAQKGFAITFTVEEGERYRFGRVDIESHIPAVDKASLAGFLLIRPGDIYNAEALDKSIDQLTIAIAKRGYPFVAVRPQGGRDAAARLVNVVLSLDEGAHTYIERINIRGNTRTRDYVIRREFDVAEGDAYNRALLDRAERRLKNLGYFKTVKITSEPGSSSDRVIVNVECEDQQTGDFSISGGYSTTDGPIGEVTIGDRNLFGRGEYAKASVTFGQFTKGFELSLAEPYVFGTRATVGVDLFAKQSLVSSYQSYGSENYGTTFRVATPLSEELTQQWRYSVYRQSVSLTPALMDCSPANPPPGCYANGEASLPVKQAVLNGPAWVSMIGSSLIYNTLDNNKNPSNGVRAQFNQDVAGVGGAVNFLKTTGDVRAYHEVADGIVGMARAQGGYLTPWGGQQLPFQNSFFGGPQLVRGFAPNGFGPRDLTPGTTNDNIGGSKYWTTTAELQSAIPYLPSDFALKVAIFADAGSLWGYRGPTTVGAQSLTAGDSKAIRSALGAGLIWDSPVGPLRLDYAVPTTKASYDVTQRLRFSAGAY